MIHASELWRLKKKTDQIPASTKSWFLKEGKGGRKVGYYGKRMQRTYCFVNQWKSVISSRDLESIGTSSTQEPRWKDVCDSWVQQVLSIFMFSTISGCYILSSYMWVNTTSLLTEVVWRRFWLFLFCTVEVRIVFVLSRCLMGLRCRIQ